MSAIAIGPFILVVALAMWVYFDATEHGKPAIPWALSVLFLGWALFLPLILYAIVRETGHRWAVPEGGGRRVYAAVLTFAGLVTLMIGASVLISGLIARGLSSDAVGDDTMREILAFGITGIISGGIIWTIHWLAAQRRLLIIADDQEFRASFFLFRSYLYTMIGLAWIVVFVAGLWSMGGGLANLFGIEEVDPVNWVPALGPLVVGLAVVAYHFVTQFGDDHYRQMEARFAPLPGPLLIMPSGEVSVTSPPAHIPGRPPRDVPSAARATRQFCTGCGAEAQPQDTFCGSCGTRLQRS